MKRILVLIATFLISLYLYADLEVTFIDVGQGDSILLLCDGESALIDTGVRNASSQVLNVFREKHVIDLDLLILTHADNDHVGGVENILRQIPMSNDGLVLSSFNYPNKSILGDKVAFEIPNEDDYYTFGTATITILSSVKNSGTFSDVNDRSLVFIVEYKNRKILFTGDASYKVEEKILDKYGNSKLRNIDILKVGHHGASSSTGIYFLTKLNPDYSVICVGSGNRYNHPSEDTLSRLVQSGSKVYRTDLHGNITFKISNSGSIYIRQDNGSGPMDPEPYLSSNQKRSGM